MANKNWIVDEDERCPNCGKPLQILTDGEFDYAERCNHCQKWYVKYQMSDNDD